MRIRVRSVRALALAATLSLSVAGVVTVNSAGAHPDHPGHPARGPAAGELFPGEGVESGGDKQHDGDEGHLPPVNNNVDLVGKAEVTNPSGAGNEGRVADVFAKGNYAWLNAFAEPTCEAGGVHTMDISDLSNPAEVTDAFIPTSEGSFAGEGIQVIEVDNEFFQGDLLIHQNETCGEPTDPTQSGGISLWDVTDPTSPEAVTLHTGDFTNPEGGDDPAPNDTHSMRAWFNHIDGHWYVVLVDDEELTDIDIVDITDPFNPVLVNDTLDLVELFGVDQEEPDNLRSIFSHDMMIYKHRGRYVMNMNYWDGGYVLLDVTNPTPGNVELIAESDYAMLDEERLARGEEISPEGNAHQSELSPNHRFMIGTDEDFGPYRIQGTIDDGPHAGTEYLAAQASDTPPVDPNAPLTGPTTYVGDACAPPAAGTGIALIERGTCPFQVKLDNVVAAGFSAGIVFNIADVGCDALVTMSAEGDIPFLFVKRETGLQLLNQEIGEDPCAQAAPDPGSASATTTAASVFDGWGYVRMFSTDINGGTIEQLDTYAIPEAQDPAFASGFGDLSVHEVAFDAEERLAYFSYYAGGLRVVSYKGGEMTEVGAFIDEGGNNFWGVETYERDGETFVLASDRDFGLYVFQYAP